MIKISVLHYNIRRQIQRYSSDYNKNISTIDIDGYINQAKNILLENLTAVITKNRTLNNNLKSLIVNDYELLPETSNDFFTNFKLPKNHYSTLSAKGIGVKKFL